MTAAERREAAAGPAPNALPPVGVRRNAGQLALLALVTAFVGLTVGLERTVVPLMAESVFGVGSALVTLAFIGAFGTTKAAANFLAGWLADRRGRRTLLIVGWAAALPVPVMLGLAPSWGWVVAANLLLGVNQGLCWTMTLVMMGDLSGRRRRGLVIGANELTGYVAIGLAALVSVPLAERWGARPVLFAAGLAVAVAGLATSLLVRDTSRHRTGAAAVGGPWRTLPRRLLLPRGHPALLTCYQAGLVTKVNDAGVWGLVPLLLAARGFTLGQIGLVAAVYPLVWGLGQGVTGAASDHLDRRPLIVAGLATQAAGLALFVVATGPAVALAASATLGIGTACAYPTLLAAVRDVAHGAWESSAFGAYRLWRDTGFVVGSLGVGALADAAGMTTAIAAAASLSAASAALSLVVLPRRLARAPSRRPETLAPAHPAG